MGKECVGKATPELKQIQHELKELVSAVAKLIGSRVTSWAQVAAPQERL
jgi:hypothetical protein